MNLATRVARVAGATATIFLLAPAIAAGLSVDQPTFVDDVAPILHANCVSCHQPGEIGPMSLRTYREVRPWARSIARAVENGDMPPWDADPGYGPWLNDISLSEDEIAAIVRWTANGAPRGEGDEPVHERPETADEWAFGEPDWVFEFDPHEVAAEGPDEFRDVPITTGFDEDRWIRAVEIKPGDRNVLHHFILWRAAEGATFQESWMAAWTAGSKPYRVPGGVRPPAAEGPQADRRLPLPPERRGGDRQQPHRSMVRRARRSREGTDHPAGLERGHPPPGGRPELRSGGEPRLRGRRRDSRLHAAHALPRKVHALQRGASGRQHQGPAPGQPLRLQLADDLPVGRADPAAGRDANPCEGRLRQLGRQPQQPRPDGRRQVGPGIHRRDAERPRYVAADGSRQ